MSIACDHSKVYSGERLATLHGIWFWVCTRCGSMGKDSGTAPDTCPGRVDLIEFYYASRRFGQDVAYLQKFVERRMRRLAIATAEWLESGEHEPVGEDVDWMIFDFSNPPPWVSGRALVIFEELNKIPENNWAGKQQTLWYEAMGQAERERLDNERACLVWLESEEP